MKNYIYIVQFLHKNQNCGFSYFENYDEVREYICEQMPTYIEDYELENETRAEFIVTRIPENQKEQVTYENIDYIDKYGRIQYIYEYDDEGERFSQPIFAYEGEDKDYIQKYKEFFYTKKDGKYIVCSDEYNSLDEMASEYFKKQTR